MAPDRFFRSGEKRGFLFPVVLVLSEAVLVIEIWIAVQQPKRAAGSISKIVMATLHIRAIALNFPYAPKRGGYLVFETVNEERQRIPRRQ